MATKTNAVRLVEQAHIPCREAFYEYDENDLNGCHAADAMGMPQEQVFKTLVARGARTGIHVFCVPVCCELDLKKAAIAAGDKSIEMVAVKELLGLTGYNFGDDYQWTSFGDMYQSLSDYYKPYFGDWGWILSEFGCSDSSEKEENENRKADWIKEMFDCFEQNRFPNIKSAVWYNETK